MELKEIQELIKFVSKSGVNEVAIEKDDFKITIKTGIQTLVQAPVAPTLIATPTQMPAMQATTAPEQAQIQEKIVVEAPGNAITINSPMIGTFYSKPNPDKPAFVNVGDEIHPGKVLCIVEAMKLFNEIEAEVSGRISKILVTDSSPIEFGQPLFEITPL